MSSASGRPAPNGKHAEATSPAAAPAVAPRRIVLLRDGEASAVQRVLAEYDGPAAATAAIHEELRRLAAEHPGRHLAAEWRGRLGWQRFVSCRG